MGATQSILLERRDDDQRPEEREKKIGGLKEKKSGEIKSIDLMRVDLPFGKRNLDDKTDRKVDHIASGWIAAPQFDTSGLEAGQLFAPVTITVTITETDELGDPIGEASKKVSENKEKILAELLKALGLKTDEKK